LLLLLLFSSKRYQEMKAIARGLCTGSTFIGPPFLLFIRIVIPSLHLTPSAASRLHSSLSSSSSKSSKSTSIASYVDLSIRRWRIINKDTTRKRTRISLPLIFFSIKKNVGPFSFNFLNKKKGGRRRRRARANAAAAALQVDIGALGFC